MRARENQGGQRPPCCFRSSRCALRWLLPSGHRVLALSVASGRKVNPLLRLAGGRLVSRTYMPIGSVPRVALSATCSAANEL